MWKNTIYKKQYNLIITSINLIINYKYEEYYKYYLMCAATYSEVEKYDQFSCSSV